MQREHLVVNVCSIVAAAILASYASLFAQSLWAQENGCKMSAAVGDGGKAQEHWIACNKALVRGQLRDGLPDWVNPGIEWGNVFVREAEAEGEPESVCGEVSVKDGLGRFGEFQRFISRGDEGAVITENRYAEQDNYVWWRKIPFHRLWSRYCE